MYRKQIQDALAKIQMDRLPPMVLDYIEKEIQKEVEELISRRLTRQQVARMFLLACDAPIPRQSANKETTEPQ